MSKSLLPICLHIEGIIDAWKQFTWLFRPRSKAVFTIWNNKNLFWWMKASLREPAKSRMYVILMCSSSFTSISYLSESSLISNEKFDAGKTEYKKGRQRNCLILCPAKIFSAMKRFRADILQASQGPQGHLRHIGHPGQNCWLDTINKVYMRSIWYMYMRNGWFHLRWI